jgi:ribosome maturation factor RimP
MFRFFAKEFEFPDNQDSRFGRVGIDPLSFYKVREIGFLFTGDDDQKLCGSTKDRLMVTAGSEDALQLALSEAAFAHNMELVAVEKATAAGQRILRVYLEPNAAQREDTEGLDIGLGIDALAAANEWVAPLVDELGPYRGAYALEVSSPGLERILRTLEHFNRFCGERVRLRSAPLDGRSNWSGRLAGVQDENVLLELEEGEVRSIPFDLIKKAHLEADLTIGF